VGNCAIIIEHIFQAANPDTGTIHSRLQIFPRLEIIDFNLPQVQSSNGRTKSVACWLRHLLSSFVTELTRRTLLLKS
jgi:hypothetical protein